MKTCFNTIIFLLILSLGVLRVCFGQEKKQEKVFIEIERKVIALNEPFSVKAFIRNGNIKKTVEFPEIQGFDKLPQASLEYTDSEGIVKGVEQLYRAKKQGIFTVNDFILKINDNELSQKGFQVAVKEPTDKGATAYTDLIEVENNPESDENPDLNLEFKNLKKVFVGLSVSKREVFVGEEVNVVLALYVASKLPNAYQFVRLDEQLTAILKKIRPQHCWEEDFGITEIQATEIKIQGKSYQQYKIYQGSFFPLEVKNIVFPAVELTLTDKSQSEKKQKTTFQTDAQEVKVKKIPAYKTNTQVSVGDLTLSEGITYIKFPVGKSVTYNIAFSGSVNFAGLTPIIPNNDENVEFFSRGTRYNVRKLSSQLTGTKVFSYHILAKKTGKIPLGNYFKFVYFNVEKAKYDTLRSRLVLDITEKGEQEQGEDMQENLQQFGDYEALIKNASPTLRGEKTPIRFRWAMNILAVGLSITAILLSVFGRKQK